MKRATEVRFVSIESPHPEEAAERPSRRVGTGTLFAPTLRDASLRDAPQGEVDTVPAYRDLL